MTIETLFPLTFSSSILSDLDCETFFFRKHIQKLMPREKSSDLTAGALFASACEMVRRGYHEEGIEPDVIIEKAQDFILSSPSTEHSIKTNENLSFCLKKYFKKFPLDGELQPTPLKDGGFAIEYFFEIDTGIPHPDFPDITITLSGRLDGLYEIKHLGKVAARYVIDEKTANKVFRVAETNIPDIAKEESFYKTRGQFILYSWMARKLGVKTDAVLARKVPLLKNYEPAIELTIPITEHQITLYMDYIYNRITELKEKYLWWKANSDKLSIQSAFYPNYNNVCNSYSRVCEYQSGCLSKEGEQELYMTLPQDIWISETSERISLKEYKERINEKANKK